MQRLDIAASLFYSYPILDSYGHPSTLVGVPVMFYSKPSVPPRGGSTLGYYYAALTGSKFLGLSARQIPIYRADVGAVELDFVWLVTIIEI